MSLILHLSDTHFGTERPEVRAALLQLAQEVQPDLAILSGDVTQRARRSQFIAARSFMDELAAPAKLVIPGNHDIPLFNLAIRAFDPYGNYSQAFGQNLEPQFSSEDLLVIGVNTTRPWRHKDGEISARQIELVSNRLKQALPQQLCIVAVHQPVIVERESDRKDLLNGHEKAIQAWAEAGADLILSGHIHLPFVCKLGLETLQQALPRPIWAVSAGTAVSRRVREGQSNSVNLIRYDPAQTLRSCQIERLDYQVVSSRFEIAQTTLLALS